MAASLIYSTLIFFISTLPVCAAANEQAKIDFKKCIETKPKPQCTKELYEKISKLKEKTSSDMQQNKEYRLAVERQIKATKGFVEDATK